MSSYSNSKTKYGIVRKQVSLFLSLEDWIIIRGVSAKTGESITGMLSKWIEPEMKKLRNKNKYMDQIEIKT